VAKTFLNMPIAYQFYVRDGLRAASATVKRPAFVIVVGRAGFVRKVTSLITW